VSPVGRGSSAYWLLGWLLSVVATYIGTQYARSRGVVAPVIPGPAALVLGVVLCSAGLVVARRFGRNWGGLVIAGIGILSIGLGLANLVR